MFFSHARHGAEHAESLAREALGKLNRERVRFDQAPAYGDRFLYHVNYVAREPEEVASHFGATMQQALFALEPTERRWRGPFESPYGFHLVLLTRNEAGYTPPLEELRARVEQEANRAVLEARFETSSRNVRLAAIHAFARYVSIQFPECLQQAQQILGVPFKRTPSTAGAEANLMSQNCRARSAGNRP